jgi:O-antigen ligase
VNSVTVRPIHALLLGGSLLTLVWGALAFGAVYPWAYRPLVIACAVLGSVILLVERRGRPRIGLLAGGLAIIALSIAVQLIPLSTDTVASLNPGGDAFLRQHNLSYGRVAIQSPETLPADDGPAAHALSIEPERTRLALSLFIPLALFLLGMTRLLSVTGAAPFARALTIFGVTLALIGIVQYALIGDDPRPLVYGFWKPRYVAHPFGPFINANHFAGWMLMAIPVAIALLFDELTQALDEAASTTHRVPLAGSPRIGSLILLAFAVVLMGLALMLTQSRSGIAAFFVGVLLLASLLWRRQRKTTTRLTVAVVCVLLFGVTAQWAGLETFVSKFNGPALSEVGSFGGRLSAWRDTLRIIQASPVTGMGLDTYGTTMILFQTPGLDVHFQEAHNEYLQLAAEGGLLVCVPILLTLIVFVANVGRRFRQAPKGGTTYWLRIGAVISLICIALQSLVDFSLQMPGNAALFAAVAALAIHQSPHLRRS